MKKLIRLVIVSIIVTLMLTLCSACGTKECAYGCGNDADPECKAEMCDDCCRYWCGLNGCIGYHY